MDGRHTAVEKIEEEILGALNLWNQYTTVTADLPDNEPSYLPTVLCELAAMALHDHIGGDRIYPGSDYVTQYSSGTAFGRR